jgi:antirestriction protein ArdC
MEYCHDPHIREVRRSPRREKASSQEEITTKIMAELEAGRVPWVQPWGSSAVCAPLAIPKNAATSRAYSGINVLILWGAVVESGFATQSWLTFRQALTLGAHVRRASKISDNCFDMSLAKLIQRYHTFH